MKHDQALFAVRHAYGSTVAVPVAKQIIDALLVVEKIRPSKPAELNKTLMS
mgnify:CR=1 FL=1